MKQIVIRKMTLSDLILNLLLGLRFWFYRNFWKDKLFNFSFENKDAWDITFKDNFMKKSWGNSDDHEKWIVGEGWGLFHPNNPLVYYGAPELTNIPCGIAKFTAKHNPKTFPDDQITGNPITIPFEVSLLSSCLSFKQQYGRFECRCTIPHDRGIWSAFWLWGAEGSAYTELDVFEMYGRDKGEGAGVQKLNLLYGDMVKKTITQMRAWGVKVEKNNEPDRHWDSKLHEFAVEWCPDKIEFFTDSVKIFRYSRKDVLNKWFNDAGVKMWIMINHSINKEYVKPDESDYYSEFFVDYIRAYKHK